MKKGEIFPITIPLKSSAITTPSKSKSHIKVRAPTDLKEGCIFTVKVKGGKITAPVPKGGLTKGEIFFVPYPDVDSVNREEEEEEEYIVL